MAEVNNSVTSMGIKPLIKCFEISFLWPKIRIFIALNLQMNRGVHPFSGSILTTVRSKILPPASSWVMRTVLRRPSAKKRMHSG